MNNSIGFNILEFIPFSEISNAKPDENYIINCFKEFDLISTLKVLSRINLFLYEMDFATQLNTQRKICNTFLNNYYREKVFKKLSNESIVFHRHQILYLMKKAFLNCIEKENFSFENSQVKYKLGTCCLIANDFLHFPDENNSVYEEESEFEKKLYLWKQFLPSYEIYYPPHLEHEIVRNQEIYNSLIIKIKNFRYMNDALLKKISISVNDYLNIIFSIIALFLLRMRDIRSGRDYIFITKENLLKNTNLDPNKVNRVLKLISLPYTQFKRKIIEFNEAKNPFNFTTFRKFPLANINEKFICLDLNFLVDKISTGLFWLLNDNLKQEQRSKFHTDWGQLFEEYIKSIFKRYFKKDERFFNLKYDNSQDEVADIVYIEKENLFLFEHKFTIISNRAKYEENINYLIEEINKKFIKNEKNEWKGVGQLANNINKLFSKKMNFSCEKIEKERIKRIFPILIVNENILNTPFSNYYLNEKFKSLINYSQLINGIEVLPVLVIFIEDLEKIEGLLSKYSLTEIILGKINKDKDCNSSFSNYIEDILNSNPGLIPKYIHSKYLEWGNSIRRYTFG